LQPGWQHVGPDHPAAPPHCWYALPHLAWGTARPTLGAAVCATAEKPTKVAGEAVAVVVVCTGTFVAELTPGDQFCLKFKVAGQRRMPTCGTQWNSLATGVGSHEQPALQQEGPLQPAPPHGSPSTEHTREGVVVPAEVAVEPCTTGHPCGGASALRVVVTLVPGAGSALHQGLLAGGWAGIGTGAGAGDGPGPGAGSATHLGLSAGPRTCGPGGAGLALGFGDRTVGLGGDVGFGGGGFGGGAVGAGAGVEGGLQGDLCTAGRGAGEGGAVPGPPTRAPPPARCASLALHLQSQEGPFQRLQDTGSNVTSTLSQDRSLLI